MDIGCSSHRINGTTIRYKLGDINAFLESQPRGYRCSAPASGARSMQKPDFKASGERGQVRPESRVEHVEVFDSQSASSSMVT